MGNYELVKKTRNAIISAVEMSIIPVDGKENSYVLIPPTGGIFTAPIKLTEGKNEFLVSKYDYNEIEEKTFVEEYQNLISDDTEFNEDEYFDSFDYKVDKDWCLDLINDSAITIDEFLIAINELLETFPTVPTNNEKRRDITPDDILGLISELKNSIQLERVLENLVNLTIRDFDNLITGDSVKLFKEIIEYEDYENFEDF